MYFSEYLDYFQKKRKDFGQGCQCCKPGALVAEQCTPGDAELRDATGEAPGETAKSKEIHILDGHIVFGNLHIVIDSANVLRVKTQSSSTFDFNYRYPILLPNNALFSKLYALKFIV